LSDDREHPLRHFNISQFFKYGVRTHKLTGRQFGSDLPIYIDLSTEIPLGQNQVANSVRVSSNQIQAGLGSFDNKRSLLRSDIFIAKKPSDQRALGASEGPEMRYSIH